MIGMGYVGLTLSVVLADKKFIVTGVETNEAVAEQLKRGEPHFHEKGLDTLMKKHVGKNLFITTKVPKEPQDVYIISVGTPINKQTKKPILDYVINATNSIKHVISDGSLIILRSTVPVGVTREIVKPILDESKKKYHLAFCPERTIEGKALIELKELPQVIGGLTMDCADKAMDLFRVITPATIEVSSLEIAEMTKIINNTYRDITFAFANELAAICEKLGLNASETIRAANFGYARSNIPVPGFAGGACLSKDPHILLDFSSKLGHLPVVTKSARDVNEELPRNIAKRAMVKLKELGKDPTKAKIFVSGFAFKGIPPTDDTRDSPTLDIVEVLRAEGVKNIQGHDFVVSPTALKELKVIPTTLEEGFKDADCVIIANRHLSYSDLNIEKYLALMRKPAVFMDCWQLFEQEICNIPGIVHEGIGFGKN
jgi:UDP-N-acetyl-D-mannosaminuronic acid dehydrogenase